MGESNPGINVRCHHCAGPLSKEMVRIFFSCLFSSSVISFHFLCFQISISFSFGGLQETSQWTVPPLIRDSFSMVISSYPFLLLIQFCSLSFLKSDNFDTYGTSFKRVCSDCVLFRHTPCRNFMFP